MATSYDAIVIGAGQAGPALAVKLARAGLKTALIEREHLGGTCVNDGCIPTKTLVASARAAHVARRAGDWGVRIEGSVNVDMKAVKARKDRVVGESIAGLATWLASTPGVTLVWGHARFVAANAVEVDGARLEAPRIFINVGGRPVLPTWDGIASVPVLTNVSMMAIDAVPEHLLIAGGSYIGLEFAQMYRRFGARVTVIEYGDRLIAREDPEVSREVQAILEREGIDFHFSVQHAKVSPGQGGRGVRVVLGADAGAKVVEGSHLLAAVGRTPNTDDLGLDKATVATDARGYIVVDDELRTSDARVWAVGECAEHRGVVYGLWAPLLRQARVAAAVMSARPAAFHGAVPATTLKVMGVDLFAAGRAQALAGDEELLSLDTRQGRYRKLVVADERLVGAVLLGDLSEAVTLRRLVEEGRPVPAELLEASFPAPGGGVASASGVVCSCAGVTREQIEQAIAAGGLERVSAVAQVTGATTGCGGCRGEVERILAARGRETLRDVRAARAG